MPQPGEEARHEAVERAYAVFPHLPRDLDALVRGLDEPYVFDALVAGIGLNPNRARRILNAARWSAAEARRVRDVQDPAS